MSEGEQHIEIKQGSDRNFGVVFGIVFLIIAAYPMLFGNELRIWSAIAAALFFLFAFLNPNVFQIPNLWWFKFGTLLGKIVAPIVMFVVYLATFVPLGLFFKVVRKDPLERKFTDAESYWKQRVEPLQPMDRQF